jgi:hypothetical protein
VKRQLDGPAPPGVLTWQTRAWGRVPKPSRSTVRSGKSCAIAGGLKFRFLGTCGVWDRGPTRRFCHNRCARELQHYQGQLWAMLRLPSNRVRIWMIASRVSERPTVAKTAAYAAAVLLVLPLLGVSRFAFDMTGSAIAKAGQPIVRGQTPNYSDPELHSVKRAGALNKCRRPSPFRCCDTATPGRRRSIGCSRVWARARRYHRRLRRGAGSCCQGPAHTGPADL